MATERFTILGRLATPDFVPWIKRHGRRLGLGVRVGGVEAGRVVVLVEGPPALIDAMEMGCLLGPIDAWVDSIEREPAHAWIPGAPEI